MRLVSPRIIRCLAAILWLSSGQIAAGLQPVPALDCATWTSADWNQFLDRQIENGFNSEEGFRGSFATLLNAQKVCKPSSEIISCLERSSKYFRQFDPSHSGQYSSLVSDEQYIASLPTKIMQLPPEFASAPHGLPKNWKDVAAQKGWPWVLFSSGTAAEARLIIYVPGDRYDRTYLYTSLFELENSDPTTYDMVQMQAIEKTGREMYFNTWDFKVESEKPRQIIPEARCVRCHLNGPRAIVIPSNTRFVTQLGGVSSAEEFNKMIVSKGPLNYSHYYDLENFPVNMNLGEYHQCAECHNSRKRHTLAFNIDQKGQFQFSNVKRKVYVEKTMPDNPWYEWTDNERSSAIEELTKEYQAKLKAWLTEKKCDK